MHTNGNIAYINGKIFTADDANPYAQAMLFARVLRGDLDRYPPFVWR